MGWRGIQHTKSTVTMPCPCLTQLPCHMSGVGWLSTSAPAISNTLTLMDGQGENFPTTVSGCVYYINVACGSCCTRYKVTARTGDVLTVEPQSACDCVPSGAKVSYASDSVEHLRLAALGALPTFQSPLVYDCVTNTVRIDCAALHTMMQTPCGT